MSIFDEESDDDSSEYDPWGYQNDVGNENYDDGSNENVSANNISQTELPNQPNTCIKTYSDLYPNYQMPLPGNDSPLPMSPPKITASPFKSFENILSKQNSTSKSKSIATTPRKNEDIADIVSQQDIFLNQDKIPCANISLNGNAKVIEIDSRLYSQHLIMEYFKKHNVIPPDVKDAVRLSNAIALANQKIVPVYTRFNFDGKRLLLDLCDGSDRIVYADKNGWSVIQKGEYKFNQPDYLKPLPVPDKNGDILDLLEFLDFDNQMDRVLVIVWIVAVLFSEIDRPILMISGPQGSGKTSVADIIRSTIDPTDITGLGLPTRERDFAVTLHRQQIPSFDNLTSIRGDIQDLMCRVVTGGGIERCKLYTDNDSFFIKFKRPMILTGVVNPITQSDLLDRTLSIKLRRFSDAERKLKTDILKRFELKQASILGGIFNTFVGALNILDTLHLQRLPRLADFYRVGYAVSEYIGARNGFGGSEFTKAFENSMRQSYNYGVDENALSFVLLSLLNTAVAVAPQDQYSFTVGILFDELKKHAQSLGIDPKELPGNASSLSRKLKEVVQALEHMGWSVSFSSEARTARKVTFGRLKTL